MTPFMLRVRAALDGHSDGPPDTEPSSDTALAAAADVHVHVRSLVEQLVAEANSVLRDQAPAITLVDVPDPDALVFSVTCGERSARVETVVNGRVAQTRVVAPGVSDLEPRRLTDEHQVESLVLTLISGQRHAATR